MTAKQKEAEEFEGAITALVAELVQERNKGYIAEENVLQYRHGSQWSHVDATSGQQNTGIFVSHSAEYSIDLRSVAERDVSVIPKFVSAMADELHGQFVRSLFDMVHEETEKIGNVVSVASAADGDDSDLAMLRGFIDMLKKIEFGVTKYGSVSHPSMYVHPENQRVLGLINRPVPEDLQRELDEVNYSRERLAIAKEARRLSRYKR